ncbi:bifunctional aspartate kinase/homoserine dehydrogenase I [Lentimicrobium sp. L6]|uniref:bifunctional aspartate kinase/homoserine dehydrogenase I n=1 Tax=Lentimicrobium sp. L6 TaxID=2735916 RepID=UPI001557876B|nr:bifunctional aspartate kinase/homoserine dehydrogenase I [Lentimicrobium sp. L6]NPD85216.1 bifunctional aspartate kinase/homoserine dehydrogenase I [Lentimicrobium sp. L6]
MKIIKFGGKSLSNGTGINAVISIIQNKINNNEKFVVIVSARGNATDELENILELAKQGKEYKTQWQEFKSYQISPAPAIDFSKEFQLLEKIFEGVQLLEEVSLKIKDLVLAQGELLAAKMISKLLNDKGIKAKNIDSRKIIVTDEQYGNAVVLEEESKKRCQTFIDELEENTLAILTGFIANNEQGSTTTLGRNGSNYSAALFANFLNAEELQNYTHVDGIYTANPDLVEEARIIDQISFQEANELASFGASILHAKTIIPLIEKNIPLRILNTFNSESKGTLICRNGQKKGVKSISVKSGVSLINLEGKGLLGKIGVDARIFNTLGRENINIGVISQGSSERGIGFVVNSKDDDRAVKSLRKEFSNDFSNKDVSNITTINDVSVVSIVGQNLQGFSKPYQSLVKNNIEILLINNNISGNNISLLIDNQQVHKAINIIHSQIFGVAKNINIAIFGKGTVGGSLIEQILKSQEQILRRKETRLNIFAVAGSKNLLLQKEGIGNNWKSEFKNAKQTKDSIKEVIAFAEQHHLENLIAIDNTASSEFIKSYPLLIENGFDLVSSNKIANTVGFDFYKSLRKELKTHNKQYLYETNVGAGLPLIDTIKLLHDSGENITRIKGVFSGSLSYIFNAFSESEESFSSIVKQAMEKGFTEPDPREDLCGNDVARKLLILARELDLENELDEVQIRNLIPENLRGGQVDNFLQRIEELDHPFELLKEAQEKDHVLRYVGDLHGDLQQSKGELDVSLVSVPKNSALGQLSGSNSIFEIYTESYGENPIVIQGAGAGAAVTARGVFGDLLRIAEKR